MKKVLALALALVMMMAIAIPAFAEDPLTVEKAFGTDEGKVGDTKVEYGVSQSYTVTIPYAVTFATLKDVTATVSVADAKLAGNEKLNISVVSAETYEITGPKTVTKTSWTMVDTLGISTPVDYWLALEANVDKATTAKHIVNDGIVLTVERPEGNAGVDGRDGSATLYFSTNGTAQEGVYEDRLTFNAAITTNATGHTYVEA